MFEICKWASYDVPSGGGAGGQVSVMAQETILQTIYTISQNNTLMDLFFRSGGLEGGFFVKTP